MSRIYKSAVYAGYGNSGEYVEVRRVRGKWYARTVELFTHGKDRVSPWMPATEDDIIKANVPPTEPA